MKPEPEEVKVLFEEKLEISVRDEVTSGETSPGKILCLDGDGVYGSSSLYML